MKCDTHIELIQSDTNKIIPMKLSKDMPRLIMWKSKFQDLHNDTQTSVWKERWASVIFIAHATGG